jgi:hypothetical protein
VEFPYFMNQKLNLKNIGHALHQFQMYRRMKLLAKNQLPANVAKPPLYVSRSYLMDSESCEICSLAEKEDQLVLCDLCNRLFHSDCINMEELPPASWVCEPCLALSNHVDEGLVEPDMITVD